MSCGLPVIAYKLPIYNKIFGDKIVTVPQGDVDEMASKVVFLLKKCSGCEKIGTEGRMFVMKYEWKLVAEKELSEIVALVGGLR